jgi:hypothetical protein
MSKNKELLSEYESVTKELETIKNHVTILKNITEDKIKQTKSENEKASIFMEFKGQIDKIKQDKSIKNKYRELQKKKSDIESQLLLEMSSKSPPPCSRESDTTTEVTSMSVPTLNTNVSIDCDTNKVDDDLGIMINKYKKLIKKPIQYVVPVSKKPVQKIIIKKKESDDIKQVKKLYNLIESLKMDIDK